MKSKILNLFIIVLLTISCNGVQTKKKEIKIVGTIKQLAPKIDISQKLIVLIIPFDGCSSCFQEAVNLIPDITEKPSIIIMPNRHKKRILNFLNDEGIDVNTVIVDTLQLSILNHLAETNPQIFLIENQKVLFSETVEISTIDSIRNVLNIRK